jgi:hypothetical protein
VRRSLHLLVLCILATGSIAAGCGDDGDDGGDERATDSCTRAVEAAPQLSAEVQDELARICEDAGGDAEAVRDATRDVCIRVIEESLPAGPAADQAREACGPES